MIPLLYALGVWQGKIQFSWNERIQGKNAGLTGHLSEILSNLPLVKETVKPLDSSVVSGKYFQFSYH